MWQAAPNLPDPPDHWPSVEQALQAVLADLRQARQDASTQDASAEQLLALDQHLRSLLESTDFASSAPDDGAGRERLIQLLQQIDHVHRDVIGAAAEQMRAIADSLQQLREDQRNAHTYERVRRHSF